MKVWQDMQFLGRFLDDVQPLGATTDQFFKLTMETRFDLDPKAKIYDDQAVKKHSVVLLGPKDENGEHIIKSREPILTYIDPHFTTYPLGTYD